MRPLVRNVILPCVLMMALSAHAALNTIVNPTLSTSVVDASVQTVSYTYNYLGQRVSKTVTQNTLPPTSVTTYYEYNDQGNLLGEYNATGNPLRQYVYLNGERVAMFDYSSGSKQTIYLANNHVGQMQYAWNSSGAVVDTRVQAPFGETASETPTGGLQIPVRFPGQVADSETGYSQNHFRDYDSSTGRYLESDPIGLDGGVNTYGYAGQNPVMYTDPNGLAPYDIFDSKEEMAYDIRIWMMNHVFGYTNVFYGTYEFEDKDGCKKYSWAGDRLPDIGLGIGIGLGSGGPLVRGLATQAASGGPKPAENWTPPTNLPQAAPSSGSLPPGHTVREMPPTQQYPNGYWRQYDANGNPVNPATGKTPANVTRAESRSQTHVPLPPK